MKKTIQLNHNTVEWEEGMTVDSLLKKMNYTFKMLVIKVDGRLVLCCTDHFGTVSLGNAFEGSILSAFNTPAFAQLRSSPVGLGICRNCWYRYEVGW